MVSGLHYLENLRSLGVDVFAERSCLAQEKEIRFTLHVLTMRLPETHLTVQNVT